MSGLCSGHNNLDQPLGIGQHGLHRRTRRSASLRDPSVVDAIHLAKLAHVLQEDLRVQTSVHRKRDASTAHLHHQDTLLGASCGSQQTVHLREDLLRLAGDPLASIVRDLRCMRQARTRWNSTSRPACLPGQVDDAIELARLGHARSDLQRKPVRVSCAGVSVGTSRVHASKR